MHDASYQWDRPNTRGLDREVWHQTAPHERGKGEHIKQETNPDIVLKRYSSFSQTIRKSQLLAFLCVCEKPDCLLYKARKFMRSDGFHGKRSLSNSTLPRPWLFFPRFQLSYEIDNFQTKNSYPYSNEFTVKCKQSLLSITHLAKNLKFLTHSDLLWIYGGCFGKPKQNQPSMHSSRMRTARLFPVPPSMHCAGGCLLLGGVGGVCSRGVSAQGGVCSGGCLLLEGGVCSWGDVCSSGSVYSGEVYPTMHWGRHPPYEQNDWQTGVKT